MTPKDDNQSKGIKPPECFGYHALPCDKCTPTSENIKSDEIDEKLVDMIDKHFPKGKCKERGASMVLLVDFLRWCNTIATEARIEELTLAHRDDNPAGWTENRIKELQQHLRGEK